MVRALEDAERNCGVRIECFLPEHKTRWHFLFERSAISGGLSRQVRAVSEAAADCEAFAQRSSIQPFAKAAEEEGADAVSLVNTFISLAIDIETRTPRIGAGSEDCRDQRLSRLRCVWFMKQPER